MPAISVIIPCYNAEQYVDRCLQSVTAQTIGIDNMEIILVNDGSTDHTLEKLKEWEKRFSSSIVVITYEQNMRQGTARNIGIRYATSEYVGFVDIDDWIEKNMYELLYTNTKNHHYDIVYGKYVRDDGEETCPINTKPRKDQFYECTKKGAFYVHPPRIPGNNGSSTIGGMCIGLYRKSLFIDNDIFFPEQLAYEDNFMALLPYYAKNTYIVDQVVYHWYKNPNSTSHERNAEHHLERLQVELMKLDAYKQRGILDCFPNEVEWDFIHTFWMNSLFVFITRFDHIPDVVNEMRDIVIQNFPNYKKNPYVQKDYVSHMIILGMLDAPVEKFSDIDLAIIQTSFLGSYRALGELLNR
jgi:glycosyltransferase involved in cell wall biosynthesis